MFQPTKLLLFRSIAPLPLTPKQETQLLDLLKASFRTQLDREHGQWHQRSDRKASASNAHPSINPPKHSQPRVTPTDRHLHSVLSNPLFSYSPGKAAERNVSRDPLDIFDEAQAKGFMKIKYATQCLEAKMSLILESSILSVRDEMKASKGGSKVLRWLISSGVANDTAFLRNLQFMRVLVSFLVAEGLQDAIWGWMERLVSELFIAQKESQSGSSRVDSTAASLLLALIKAEAEAKSISLVSLDAAYNSLARVAAYLKGFQQYPNASTTSLGILSNAGWFLLEASITKSWHYLPASPTAFESFINMVPLFFRQPNILQSHLRLHHPTQPDARDALKYLKEIESIFQGPASPSSHRRTHRAFDLGLDAVKLLLEQNHLSDAKWVMGFLQQYFPSERGLSQDSVKQSKRIREATCIFEMLNCTELA